MKPPERAFFVKYRWNFNISQEALATEDIAYHDAPSCRTVAALDGHDLSRSELWNHPAVDKYKGWCELILCRACQRALAEPSLDE